MERLQSQKSPRTMTMMRSMERAASQKAIQATTSSSCKAAAMGFLFGVCLTYILFAAGTSFRGAIFGFDGIHLSFHHISNENIHVWSNQTEGLEAPGSKLWKMEYRTSPGLAQDNISYKATAEELKDGESKFQKQMQDKEKMNLLQSLWEAYYFNQKNESDPFWNTVGVDRSNIPKAPHVDNCKARVKASKQFDTRGKNGSRPFWSIWKGYLGLQFGKSTVPKDEEEELLLEHRTIPHGPYPPWVEGGDEDNLPMTRRVQRDIWLHQHPSNCHDPQLRFLFTDWEINPGFGIGAQIAGMAGLLALAINQKRILVTNYFNRADHEGCTGSVRSHWSCYFLPETSAQCRERALQLVSQAEAWNQGIITSKENYTTKEIWVGKTPSQWGKPWERMQPTTEIDSKLLKHHRTRDRRWWRSQAVRYLMRFQSEYTCKLLNIARHEAFGMKAAKMVLPTLPPEWPKVPITKSESEIEHYVWANHKPWTPRPLLSIHVRLGDKAKEMKMVGFQSYMHLAQHIRRCFPDVKNIWLSTEMQVVIDQSKFYVGWNFYYTNVTRQVGNMTMPAYEASLGRETSTNYPLVNFLMAADADFFIGALGSTWCFLIDGMRSTGGKVMAGYLSVNKDRFW